MVDGNTSLHAGFYVRQVYDFSKAYGVFFHWWGVDLGDVNELKLETPTGSFITFFSDGPAGFREVFIPWSRFNEVGLAGSRPDKSRITAILWTVSSPGLRRVDYFGIYESPILRAGFEVRRSTNREVKAGFAVRHSSSEELKTVFEVNP